MASNVEIANRALQALGAKRIASLSEDSRNARSVNSCFDSLRRAELRKHPWSFAVKRASLPASATAPLFVKQSSFPLPSDFIRLLPPDSEANYNDRDWQIEGRNIVTNDSAPLEIRYIYDVTDPNEMDALFREALALKIAEEVCEEITQSNTKKETAILGYRDIIAEARRANAFERVSQKPVEDEWLTVRN